MSAQPVSDQRIRDIILLLKARLDYLPSQHGQSYASTPGPAANGKVACGCGTLRNVKGRMEWTAGSSLCQWCKGTGFRSRLRIDGDATQDERGALFDPMTYAHDRSVKAGHVGGLRVMTDTETKAELARLAADKRAREHSKSCTCPRCRNDSYGWENAKERRDRSGSFRELELALEALRDYNPLLRGLVDATFSEGRYGEGRIAAGSSRSLLQALLFLDARMPEPIRIPQALGDRQRGETRQATVVEVYARTNSLSKTAHECRLQKRRVKELLKREGVEF